MPNSDDLRHRQFLRAYTVHESAVRAFVRRLVPTRADADDVMQDVSLVLWEKYATFRDGADFRAWAFGVARFEVLAWTRDKRRDRLVLDDHVVQQIAEESLAAEPRLERQREALDGCLQKLDVPQRDLLLRAYAPESRIHELAPSSGRSVPGFYQWLHRMRRLLQDCIRKQLGLEGVG